MILSLLYAILLFQEPQEESPVEKIPDIMNLISFSKIILIVITLVAGYFILKLFKWLLELFAEKSARYRITIKGFIPVVMIFGWTLILFFVINSIVNPPIETVITISASLGIAVGFASQDILKNIFGGIVIIFDRPFQVGDKIEVSSYYGEVISIGLRSTKIITPDDSMVSVPNSEIVNNSVSNSNSGEANCQVVAEIYLPITADIHKCRELALEAAKTSRYIYMRKPVVVLFFQEIKERKTFLKMRLKAYVADIRDEFAFKSDMTELVVQEFVRQGILKDD